jgi:DNA helicase-2/ATP-dependent DNA helicase PcrA
LSDLNTQQKAAVCHVHGPAMVIAGAGTGKTRVITSRIAYLVEQGHALPEEILALTFTDKAAAEMEERVDQLLPYGYVDTRIKTFHALGYEILQEHGFELNLPPHLKVISSLQQHIILQMSLESAEQLDHFRPSHNPQQFRSVLLNLFSRLKDEGIDPIAYKAGLQKLKKSHPDSLDEDGWARYFEAADIYADYQGRMLSGGLLDYGDQLLYVQQLLQKKPQIQKIYHQQYKFILVDEYQDTNSLQARILKLLVSNKQNIMVVGDDDQSIYRFRGAELENMLNFSESYSKTKYYSLTENYRSTQHIVDVAYALIQHNNPARLEVKTGLSKKLQAQKRGRKPCVQQYIDHHEEFHALATDIQKRQKASEDLSGIAILCRNNHQADDLIQYLQHLGIPVASQAGKNLLHLPEVRQCIDFVRVLHDVDDSAALYRYLVSPKIKSSTPKVMELSAQAQRTRTSLGSVILENRESSVAEYNALVALEGYRKIAHNHSIGEILYQFITDGGYLDRLARMALSDNQAASSMRQLAAFFGLVKEFEAVENHRDSLHFWNYIQDMYSSDVLDEVDLMEQSEGVYIMTIHRSKGLEFDTVYLYDMTEGNFPAVKRTHPMKTLADFSKTTREVDFQHEAEERRLMYVGVTRAKSNLTLTFSLDHGGKRARKPSRFLLEAFGPNLQIDGTAKQGALPAVITRYHPTKNSSIELPTFPVGADGYLTLTPSQVTGYLTDPSRFFVQHVLKFPSPPSHQMVYGVAMHAALEYFYDQKLANRQPNLKDMIEVFRNTWRTEGFVSVRHEKERRRQGEVSLSHFYAKHVGSAEIVLAVEQDFKLEIVESKVRIHGRYDLVVKNTDGGVSIRDFKTSHVANLKSAQAKVRDAISMGIYALAWDEQNDDKTTSIALYFTESQMLAERSKIEHQKTLTKIATVADGIRAGKYPRRGNLTNLETEGLV